jgi:hypothetical protein
MDIISLTKNFKEITEWQRFCEAQYQQIIKLSREITELKDKNISLEKIVNSTVPLLQDPNKPKKELKNILQLTDEEAIAVMEIAKLKDISLERPLDPAETKQYEIYTKTLQLLKQTKKAPELLEAEKLSDEQILTLVDGETK